MPRADFYLIQTPKFAADPMRVVCVLARRLFEAGEAALILAADIAQAEEIDGRLWEFQSDAFIPHQIAGREPHDARCPVLIVPPGCDAAMRPQLINLREVDASSGFERVLEVVPPDEAAKVPLRRRWKAYKARGLELYTHPL